MNLALEDVLEMTKKNTHKNTIDLLVGRLELKSYTEYIETNIVYCLGEVDILVEYGGGREAYWEIKSNHTKKGYKKAVKQLKRWSITCHNTSPHKTFYGIYYARNYGAKIICKNGKVR